MTLSSEQLIGEKSKLQRKQVYNILCVCVCVCVCAQRNKGIEFEKQQKILKHKVL